MKIKNLLRIPQSKYPVKAILRWLWHAWRGNRLQAVLNAALGLLGVAASLMSVWAVQNAIDVALLWWTKPKRRGYRTEIGLLKNEEGMRQSLENVVPW